ncbi:MAG TPA: exosortase-associated EpsI family protein [Candidatus Dormibacteraeota bacterium]|jgi:hypothetical protein
MRSLVRRRLLVAGLILAAGAAALGLRVDDPGPPALPPVGSLLAASGWRVESASAPVELALRYQQWLLLDAGGHEALLYVGATARARTVLDWSGELGYQGAGYVVADQRDVAVTLDGGRRVAVGASTVTHVDERRLVRYAVVGPSGVGSEGRDLLLPAVRDLALGRSPTYYVVRVAVADDAGAAARADAALASVLSRLISLEG